MSKAWIVLLLLAAATGWGDVCRFYDNAAGAIPEFKEAPVIDGALEDAAWRSARRLTQFRHYTSGELAKLQTVVRGGFDEQNLYLAFECLEPDVGKLKPGEITSDTLALFAVDHIEVFIKTAPVADTYYQFAVEAFGARYESEKEDTSWSPQWRSATKIGEGKWCAEMAIPWEAIAEKRPKFLLANFCRSRRLEPSETTAWSPTFGLFHNPARFGGIALGETPPITVTSPHITEVARGKHNVSASVKSSAKTAQELTASVYAKTVGKELALAATAKASVPPGGALTVSAPFELAHAYSDPVVLVLRDAKTEEALWFTGPQPVSLRGTQGLRVARALDEEPVPALQWLETERLRACCYGFGIRPSPDLNLEPVAGDLSEEPPPELAFRGEGIIRVHVGKGEQIRFRIAAGEAGSLFTSSTYAVFDPEGKHVSDGIVAQGESEEVAIPVEQEGLHVLWVNSGPASSNCVTLQMRNRSWVVDGRGKGAYFATFVSLNSLRDLSLAGFNTAFLGAWMWGMEFATDEGLKAWAERVAMWAEAAERYHIGLIPYVGWGCAKSEVQAAGDYRKNLSTREIDGPRPCPLSEKYWERTFLRRALAIAELSKQYPSIVGFGLDPESYYFSSWYKQECEKRGIGRLGWAGTTFFQHDECFCDHCFFGFLESEGLERPEVPKDGKARFEWLKGKGLEDKYYERMADEVRALTSGIREKVHAVNPDLVFGVMLLGANDSYWCQGASRGLGTPRTPVLDYDEGTYTVGYTPAVERQKRRFKEWGAHVLHGGTLWGGKHWPQDPHYLSAQMYHFAIRDGGYWFWPGASSLWRSPDTLGSFYTLAGEQEDYWKAFVHANQEIDRKLKKGESYASELDSLRRSPPPPKVDEKGHNVWARKPLFALRVKSGTRLAFHVPEDQKRFAFVWGLREGSGEWQVVITSPGRSITERRVVSAEKGREKVEIEVRPDESRKAWTVQVERVGDQGGEYLGVGVEGLPRFFSSSPSALLVADM